MICRLIEFSETASYNQLHQNIMGVLQSNTPCFFDPLCCELFYECVETMHPFGNPFSLLGDVLICIRIRCGFFQSKTDFLRKYRKRVQDP